MSALRMVWIISRHYNRDERMVPLMERIANQLCDRVARSINVRTLFRYLKYCFVTSGELELTEFYNPPDRDPNRGLTTFTRIF